MRKKLITVSEEDFGIDYDEEYEEYVGDYVLREWTFGEREDIIELSSVQKVDTKTSEITVEMKSSKFRVFVLQACLRSAPFKTTVKAIRGLPIALAEYLFEEVSELNETMSDGTAKKFKSG